MRKLTKEDFIKKANEIHHYTYDYSKVEYKRSNVPVIITCRKHGDFLQRPDFHTTGSNCPKCAIEQRASHKRGCSTKEKFVEKANRIHDNKYTYDKTVYVNEKTKVIITCPKHGDFMQQPRYHLNHKQGCPLCGNERISEYRTSNTEEFIEKAKQKHGDKFDYTNVKYTSARDVVEIICKKHGPFKQVATVHLRCKDGGCPVCKRNLFCKETTDHLNNEFPSTVDKCKFWNINKATYNTRIKNGWSEKEALTCPLKMSLGEFRIKCTLETMNITFLHNTSIQRPIRDNIIYIDDKQNCFDTIRKIADKNNISARTLSCLKYDFILLDNNKIMCFIEFDGEQHFRYNTAFFKTIEEFNYRILLDKTKMKIAKALNIPIFRIRYDQESEIENLIPNVLKNIDNYTSRYNPILTNEEYWSILEKYNVNHPPKQKMKYIICVETGKMYEGTMFAQHDTKADRHCILKCLRGERKTAGGYHWRYATEEEIKEQRVINT